MLNAVDRNGHHNVRSAVLGVSCADIVNHNVHIGKQARNVGKKSDTVETVDVESTLEFLFDIGIPICSYPRTLFDVRGFFVANCTIACYDISPGTLVQLLV